jgi:hypothetical protein
VTTLIGGVIPTDPVGVSVVPGMKNASLPLLTIITADAPARRVRVRHTARRVTECEAQSGMALEMRGGGGRVTCC